ncbi:MAG TPA: aldose epimerase family protein [Candidatus Baltobacteraceae bacterium]|jgi:aldose 1-epimerase|nr:aldose epimerase family protein [Candidatus Baltobacteraceae bacterium]
MEFGVTDDGQPVERVAIGSQADGLSVDLINYGATVVAINVPDRHGVFENVALHYDALHGYEHSDSPRPYYGATIGRYANRIGGAQFTLEGRTFRLSANDGENTLHGGAYGFDRAVWTIGERSPNAVVFSHLSRAGDQGFPGNLAVTVIFAVRNRALRVDYLAQSDADTVVNFTNHSYFNLNPSTGTAAGHALQIFADAYTEVDDDLIPTGELKAVKGTGFDFVEPRMVGTQPFDINFALRESSGPLREAAMLGHPASGRMLDILTTEPGLQLYSGNPRGVALETQHFPDSPNRPHFPTTVLRAGARYTSTTLYHFSVSA